MNYSVTRSKVLLITDAYTLTVTDFEMSRSRRMVSVPLINGRTKLVDGGSDVKRIKIRGVIPTNMVSSINGYFSQELGLSGWATTLAGIVISAYTLESYRITNTDGTQSDFEAVLLSE